MKPVHLMRIFGAFLVVIAYAVAMNIMADKFDHPTYNYEALLLVILMVSTTILFLGWILWAISMWITRNEPTLEQVAEIYQETRKEVTNDVVPTGSKESDSNTVLS